MRSFYITCDHFLRKEKKKKKKKKKSFLFGKRSHFSCFLTFFSKREKKKKSRRPQKRKRTGMLNMYFFFTSPYMRAFELWAFENYGLRNGKPCKWWCSGAEYFKICENDRNLGLKMGVSRAAHTQYAYIWEYPPPPPGVYVHSPCTVAHLQVSGP